MKPINYSGNDYPRIAVLTSPTGADAIVGMRPGFTATDPTGHCGVICAHELPSAPIDATSDIPAGSVRCPYGKVGLRPNGTQITFASYIIRE